MKTFIQFPSQPKPTNASSPFYCQCPSQLTALSQGPVVLDVVGPGSAPSEQPRPVDGVVVAEVGVLAEVDAAVADLPERMQPQGGEGGDVHHHERETSAAVGRRTESRREKERKWGKLEKDEIQPELNLLCHCTEVLSSNQKCKIGSKVQSMYKCFEVIY